MPPRDAEATRRRILDAAAAEFAAHGLAGARVDRIAEAAAANKRMIYAYFGNKDELFDAVVASVIEEIHAAVPLTPDDLAGYAGRLFDYVVERPDVVAIDAWRRLERPGPNERERELFAAKLDALGARFPGGPASDGLDAVDVLVVVSGLAAAWFSSPGALTERSPRDLAARRAHVVDAVARALDVPDPA